MNVLITTLAVLGSLIALFFFVALFIKKEYTISREIIISRPVREVFDYVRIQKNQEAYNKWVMTDPAKKIELHGTDGTPGFVYAWNGNKQAGEGELEILRIKELESVDTEVRFVRPFPSSAQISMKTFPEAGGRTRVTWGFKSAMKYPMNLILVLMGLEKVLAKDMDTSLGNLKRILER